MTDAVSVLVSCEQTLAIFLPFPFLCSPGKKVEVKISSLALVAFLQSFLAPVKRYSNPKLSLYLTNLTHQSGVPASHLHFLLALCPFAPLPFALCYQVQEPNHDWYLHLGAQNLADLSSSLWCPALWLEAEHITAA